MTPTTSYNNLTSTERYALIDHYINRSKSYIKAIDNVIYYMFPEVRVQKEFDKFVSEYMRD